MTFDPGRSEAHPDCHVVVEGAYYSAPHRLIGGRLWVRYNGFDVVIYHEYERVATHRRGPKGTRHTNTTHYPPEKVAWLMATPRWCREKADRIGPATSALVHQLLDERPLDRLRGVQAILRLEGKHGATRLEAACRRATAFGDRRYITIKRILERGLESEPYEDTVIAATATTLVLTYTFARPGSEIFGLIGTEGDDHGPQAPVDPQAQSAAPLGHLGDLGCA